MRHRVWAGMLTAMLASCATPALAAGVDTLISGGIIYDGLGGTPHPGWMALKGDRISAIGTTGEAPPSAGKVINAHGNAVSPGFIDMLSWATDSLIADGRGLSDITQGETLEVMGEGWSIGPLNAAMKVQTVKGPSAGKSPA